MASARDKYRAKVSRDAVQGRLAEYFGGSMHAKRVLSLANGVLGVMLAGKLGIHAIGRAMAARLHLDAKHSVKQVDRLLSNEKLDMGRVMELWVRQNLGKSEKVVVAMDWTEFDRDRQSTLTIHLVTKHGRSAPLMWWTVRQMPGQHWRTETEHRAVQAFAAAIPENVQVVLLADRGFGSQEFYELLDSLGIQFIIRFRKNIEVESAEGEVKSAGAWVPTNGRARLLKQAMVTAQRTPLPILVFVQAKRMKDAWCLASTLEGACAAEIIHLYGRRFTIEQSFRDTKNHRLGFGLSETRLGRPERRDRMILLGTLAHYLLTLLGAASEALGFDRLMRTNTVKYRTHSLLNQGLYWFGYIPNMLANRMRLLLKTFGELVQKHETLAHLLALEARALVV